MAKQTGPGKKPSGPRGGPFGIRILACARDNMKPALRTIRFLLIIMLSVSFVVLVLENTGLLSYVAAFMNPVMRFIGLPGEASLAYLSSICINIYSAIAVMETMTLSGKQLIILTTMCLIAHNFFVECIVMKKAGSRLYRIVLLRIVVSFLAGWVLHFIVPGDAGPSFTGAMAPKTVDLSPAVGLHAERLLVNIGPWLKDSLFLILQISIIVFAVMFLQRILIEFGLMKKLGAIVSPLIAIAGLPANTAYVWLIANIAGVAYGAGILIEEVKSGNLSRSETDLFNHHASISHSQVEDTILFVSLGVPYVWAALPRFILAVIVVWLERARRALFRSSFRVKLV